MRMIDADELEQIYSSMVTKGKYPPEHFINAIRESPTVGNVQHSKWVEYDTQRSHVMACDLCHWSIPTSKLRIKDFDWNFCPHCGAEMNKKL